MPLREMNREQIWLLPPTLDELGPQDHPARFLDALDWEDWAEIGVGPEGDPLGASAYHLRALLSAWLYGFMTNGRSYRKPEAACRDQIPYLITGRRVISSQTKASANRAAAALQLAANALHRSDSALGVFLRRKKAQLDLPRPSRRRPTSWLASSIPC